MAGYPAASASQFLSKIASVSPKAATIAGMSYMAATDGAPHLRTVESMAQQLGERLAKTDTERAGAWLKESPPFAREPGENLKDFWPLLLRVTTRLEAMSVKVGGGNCVFTGPPHPSRGNR